MNLAIDRLCIIDFEASSLPLPGQRSFPIEVAIGWVPDGSQPWDFRIREWLIAPEREWLKWTWDPAAQAIHGLSLEYLRQKGEPRGRVAQQLLVTIGDRILLSDAPDYEFRWLDTLLGYSDRPPKVGHLDLVLRSLAGTGPEGQERFLRAELYAKEHAPIEHKASSDVRHQLTRLAFIAAKGATPPAVGTGGGYAG